MSIEVEHNGHKITWSEVKDVWQCWQMNIEHPKLTVVKTKLNQIDAETRRVDNIPVIHMDGWDRSRPSLATVTLIDDDGKNVWVTKKSGNQHSVRSKEPLAALVENTPHNQALIKAAQALDKAANEAREKAAAAWKAIPPLTLDRLKELNIKPEEKVEGEDECPKPKTKRR